MSSAAESAFIDVTSTGHLIPVELRALTVHDGRITLCNTLHHFLKPICVYIKHQISPQKEYKKSHNQRRRRINNINSTNSASCTILKMKLLSFLTTALLTTASASPTLSPRATSNSWAGTSNYFIQSMSDADQDAYLRQLSQDGIKVIRVWINAQPGGGACVKGSISVSYVPRLETTLGRYNYETLDLLDKTLVKIGSFGMKALISPHDGNLLQGPNGYFSPYLSSPNPLIIIDPIYIRNKKKKMRKVHLICLKNI